MILRILACVSEKYVQAGRECVTAPTSVSFIQEAFPGCEVMVASPLVEFDGGDLPNGSKVNLNCFFELPYFSSIQSFVIECIKNPLYYRRFTKRCLTIISESNCSKVWLRNPSIGSLIFGICALKLNKPIVNHMCANALLGWKNEKYTMFEKFLGRCFSYIIYHLIRKIASHPRTINVCTGDVLESLCKKFSNKTYQFVDLLVSPPAGNARHSDSCKKFLFIGRVQPDKGVFELCSAFSRLPDLQLTIAGYGPSLKEITDRYASFQNVNILGRVEHSSIGVLLAQSDCVIVPSKNSYEGFPRVIMESWSYGKPVIVADTGGVKAFVKSYINGILVKRVTTSALEACICELSEDPQLYAKLLIGVKNMKDVSNKEYWFRVIRAAVANG